MDKKYLKQTQWLSIQLSLAIVFIVIFKGGAASAQSPQSAPSSITSVEMNVPKTLMRSQLSKRLKKILSDGEKLTVTQVTEAILQLIVQDISYLKVNLVNPMVIRGVIPQAPLAASMSTWAESRLSSFIHQASSIKLKECISCKRQITSIDDQRLVFLYGNIQNKDFSSASNKPSFQSALDITLTWSPSRMTLIAHARLLSSKGEILWHESYRSGDGGTLAKRGIGEKQNETSIGKYQSLAKIPKPQPFTIKELVLGIGVRSGQGSSNLLARVGGGYGVFFGLNNEQVLMLQALISFNQRFFTDFNLEYRKRLGLSASPMNPTTKLGLKEREQKASQGLWFKAMLGIPFAPLIAGHSFGLGLHYMSRYRVGLSGNLLYAFNFDEREGPPPGGFGADVSLIINF